MPDPLKNSWGAACHRGIADEADQGLSTEKRASCSATVRRAGGRRSAPIAWHAEERRHRVAGAGDAPTTAPSTRPAGAADRPAAGRDGTTDRLLDEIAAVYRASFARFLRVAAAIVGDPELGRDAVQESVRTRDSAPERVSRRRSPRGVALAHPREPRVQLPAERRVCRPHPHELVGAPRSRLARRCCGRDVAGADRPVPERQRLALFLRYYADLDYRQIAHALGVTPGTVAATLSAAHRTLRARLLELRAGDTGNA